RTPHATAATPERHAYPAHRRPTASPARPAGRTRRGTARLAHRPPQAADHERCRSEMWEEVRDPVLPQLCRQSLDCVAAAVRRLLCLTLVLDEPGVVAEPGVAEP